MKRRGLRQRVAFFFALVAAGGLAAIVAGLALGFRQAAPTEIAPFVTAGVVAGFGLVAIAAGIWLLFDENVAKPVIALAARLRAHAHGGAEMSLDLESARWLDDLVPAAAAVADKLGRSTLDAAEALAERTAELAAEKDRLAAVLTGMPVAVSIIGPGHKLVLYDGQSADLLGQEGPVRLNASIFEYLRPGPIEVALDELHRRGARRAPLVAETLSGRVCTGHIRLMGEEAGYMLMLEPLDPEAERPLTYDFALLAGRAAAARDTPLRELSFVVFDTETTGLDPASDAIVQIGAVRVLGGRIVPGEVFETLVDPGRPIPAAAARVHRITTEAVAGAPGPANAAEAFRRFAQGSIPVAHNAPFDMAMLRRAGAAPAPPVLDTVLISAVVYGGHETHTLDALVDRLGVALPEAERHTALGDARATAEVLVRLLAICEGRGLTTLGALIDEMRRHERLVEALV
ncbi:3'-5' exonuclease [Limimaricola sp. G21655-S1]|uniref:3'-5' exonuclease n=1 Tax=Limimaricola sp. G21655-S1 TaxID=3014768 RepID=UPI0022AE874C|nr:3'-5' exonuclease [Limimaricola sp. G21655-S1]MCZ4260692.1 3'-5' exonuclease [Limimaricola sp. G21655-S1]